MGLPRRFILWLKSYFSNRFVQLAFDGEKQPKTPIEIGVPQGSPISPILYLIYTRNVFLNRKIRNIRVPSYVNNIGLITSSKSIKENCSRLQKAAEELIQRQEGHCI